MHGGRRNEHARTSEGVGGEGGGGGGGDPPECRRNLNLPSYFFFSYISHPLDLHKSFTDSAAVLRSSQEANQKGGWTRSEVTTDVMKYSCNNPESAAERGNLLN